MRLSVRDLTRARRESKAPKRGTWFMLIASQPKVDRRLPEDVINHLEGRRYQNHVYRQ